MRLAARQSSTGNLWCCRRTKQRHVIDFENLAELPPDAFELAPHKEISLKAMPAVNTLLPPDHHYKVCFSSCLRQLSTPCCLHMTTSRAASHPAYVCVDCLHRLPNYKFAPAMPAQAYKTSRNGGCKYMGLTSSCCVTEDALELG